MQLVTRSRHALAIAAIGLLGLAPTSGASASEGNNTVPILIALFDTDDCRSSLAKTAGAFRTEFGYYNVAEFLFSCVQRGTPEIAFLSSSAPSRLVRSNLEGVADEVTELAGRHADHAVYLVGVGNADRATVRLAHRLPRWVKVEKLTLLR